MIENNRNNEQIYGRNDMIMLDPNNKIYGSLGIADNYVMKTEEGTRLILSNPKPGKFGDVLTEFNMYGMSSQNKTTGKNLLKYPYAEANETSSGVTFTDNKDGSITISGTSTEIAYYNLYSNIDGKRLTLASGTYKLVVKGRSKCDIIVSNDVSTTVNAGTFTITDGHNEIYCYIVIREGLTVGEIIYPMIQLASITDESYEPYTGGIPSPSPEYPQEIKSVVNPIVKVTNEDGTKSQTVTLPYTLNAIPVSSGGNYTDQSGQQWGCDEVDLERGVKVQRVKVRELSPDDKWAYQKLASGNNNFQIMILNADVAANGKPCFCNILPFKNVAWDDSIQNLPKIYANNAEIIVSFPPSSEYSSLEAFKQLLTNVKSVIYYILATSIETPLTQEEIEQYKKLSIRTPTTIVENNYNTWMKATYKSTESV